MHLKGNLDMNIFHFISDFKTGGVEIAAKSSLKNFTKDKKIFVVVFGSVSENFISDLSKNQKQKIINLNYKSWNFFSDVKNFLNFIKKYPPSVFLYSLWKSYFLLCIFKILMPNVTHIVFFHSSKFFSLLDKFFKVISARIADKIFVDSEAAAKFVKQFSDKKSTKISLMINRQFDIPKKSFDELRFVFFGRINKVKRIDKAIELIKFLKENKIKCSFSIYGVDDGDLNNLKIISAQNELEESIFFKGELAHDELPRVLEKYNMFVQLSESEGMSMSTVEAMQNGLVCLVTPVGEIPNYTVNLKNAIHFNDNESSLECLRNRLLLESVSANAISTFSHSKTYSQSLEESI